MVKKYINNIKRSLKDSVILWLTVLIFQKLKALNYFSFYILDHLNIISNTYYLQFNHSVYKKFQLQLYLVIPGKPLIINKMFNYYPSCFPYFYSPLNQSTFYYYQPTFETFQESSPILFQNETIQIKAEPHQSTEEQASESYIENEQKAKLESRQLEINQLQRSSKFKYPKKNVQSNVVNQIFSFITSKPKSQALLEKIFKHNREKVEIYFQIMKQLKKKCTKYMGRHFIQSMFEIDEDHPIYLLHRKLKFRVSLKVSQIRKAVHILTNYFLKNKITSALLTSSKLDKNTLKQHLSRAREIYNFLNNIKTASSPRTFY